MAIKFLCNGMLGKLCKYLRMCGIDTAYSNEGVKAYLEARREGRIFLTRNSKLEGKEGVFFLQTEETSLQIKTVIRHFSLKDRLNFFSRCLRCNEPLEAITKEGIKGIIPYYTYQNFAEFVRCPRCQRIYWRGSHYEKMLQELKGLLELND